MSINLYVNGNPFPADEANVLSYEDAVRMATGDYSSEIHPIWIVKFSDGPTGRERGHLNPGEAIPAFPGLKVKVAHTGNT